MEVPVRVRGRCRTSVLEDRGSLLGDESALRRAEPAVGSCNKLPRYSAFACTVRLRQQGFLAVPLRPRRARRGCRVHPLRQFFLLSSAYPHPRPLGNVAATSIAPSKACSGG